MAKPKAQNMASATIVPPTRAVIIKAVLGSKGVVIWPPTAAEKLTRCCAALVTMVMDFSTDPNSANPIDIPFSL